MRVHGPSALRAATQINGRRLNTPYHGGTDGGILRDAHSKLAEVYGAASPGAVYELVLLPHISVETLHITLVPSLRDFLSRIRVGCLLMAVLLFLTGTLFSVCATTRSFCVPFSRPQRVMEVRER